MAKTNSTAAPIVLDYPSKHSRVYAIAPDATRLDVQNLLESKMHHLAAMLVLTYGDRCEEFRNMNDEIQDNLMWACADLAREIKELREALDEPAMARPEFAESSR